MTKVTEAVRDAIATAQNQRSTVPGLTIDWIKRAEIAIKRENLPAVYVAFPSTGTVASSALATCTAHSVSCSRA